MTREDIEILLSGPVRRAIEDNLGNNPMRVALDRSIPHASLVATQVKYLQRARTKLPSYYEARCVIPPLAFEQASSEQTAVNRLHAAGALAVDLTCGLGVDSLALSRQFGQVIAIERDHALAFLAERNFALLGAHNIKVVNQSAEEFLAANSDLRADLIFADPDRRSASGRKLVRLEDCAPDIVEMLPGLRAMAPRIVVKLSPMFDVDEVFRIFGQHTRTEVVSLDGECKEVVAETGESVAGPCVAASVVGFGTVEYALPYPESPIHPHHHEEFQYLVVPDVALAKARIARRYFTYAGFHIESDNSYAFGSALPEQLPGRAYLIEEVKPYSPKKLKKELKDAGIKRVDILKRDFPYAAAEIARQLGVAEGGTTRIAFTRMNGVAVAIFVR